MEEISTTAFQRQLGLVKHVNVEKLFKKSFKSRREEWEKSPTSECLVHTEVIQSHDASIHSETIWHHLELKVEGNLPKMQPDGIWKISLCLDNVPTETNVAFEIS